MAKDFRIKQLRTTQLIVSGSSVGSQPSLLIYSASAATNIDGGVATALLGNVGNAAGTGKVGTDVWAFISGSTAAGDPAHEATVLFGGNVHVSGSLISDSALTLKRNGGATIELQNTDTTITNNDILGNISFSAPDEASGTDAILLAAEIAAVAEGTFSATNNATKLSFKTGLSEAASEKMVLDSAGNLIVTGDVSVLGNDIKNSDGEVTISMDANQNVSIAGDLTVTGGDIIGPTDGDLIVKSDGNLTFRIDADNDETSQKFAFMNNASTEIAALADTGDLQIDGDITVSGNNIKDSSGNSVIAFAGDGGTTLAGDLNIPADIKHIGDSDTKISFDTDKIILETGDTGAVIVNETGEDTDFRVETNTKSSAIQTIASQDAIKFLSNAQSDLTQKDVNFFVDGTVNSRGTATRGTALFAGDLVVSGTLYAEKQILEVDFSQPSDLNLSGAIILGDIGAAPDGAGQTRIKNAVNNNSGSLFVSTGSIFVGLQNSGVYKETNITPTTTQAGNGLGQQSLGVTNTSFHLDINELTGSLTNANIADGDLFAVADVNAANEVKKITLANVATKLAGDGLAAASGVVSLNIDGLGALGGTGIHQTDDHFVFSDGGTEKKITFSNLEDAIFANISGDATIAAGGDLSLGVAAITNQTAMTGDVVDGDELLINDGGALKRVDFSVVRDAVFNDVSGDATIAAGGDLSLGVAAITNQTEMTGDVDDADELVINDGGALKRIDFSLLRDAVFNDVSGDATVAAGGVLTIAGGAVHGTMLNTDVISAQGEMTGDVADTDELLISDAGVVKRADFSVVRDAVFNDVSGDATIAAGGALTIGSAAVHHGMLNDDIISGQSELAHADINDADDLMIHDNDAAAVKKVGVDSLRDHFFGVVSGDATVADGGALTIAGNAVEGSMLNTNVADTSTIEVSSNTLSVLKVPNAITVDNATISLNTGTTYDGSAAKTISVKDGGIDSDALASSVAGTGIDGGGGSALSVAATQTSIESITKDTFTTIGRAGSANDVIDFGVGGSVKIKTNNADRVEVSDASTKITNTVVVGGEIQRDGDADTKIGFLDDRITVTAGNVSAIDIVENGASSSVVVNEGANTNLDFRVETVNKQKAIFVNAGLDYISIGDDAGASQDVHLFVSGAIDGISSGNGVTVFGGDLVVSGALLDKDHNSIGLISVKESGTFTTPPQAQGTNSFALGFDARAGNIGGSATAGAIAIGNETIASGARSLALGSATGNNTASGISSVVVGGEAATASGDYSAVLGGQSNTAAGDYAAAIGRSNTVNGNDSIAIGKSMTIGTADTIAIGNNSNNATIELHGLTTAFADLNVAEYIKRSGDADTFIRFNGDRLRTSAGGREMLDMKEDADNTRVRVLSNGTLQSGVDEAVGTDIAFYVSGTVGNVDSKTHRGTALFGGDIVASGSINTPSNLSVSGSLFFNKDTIIKRVGSDLTFDDGNNTVKTLTQLAVVGISDESTFFQGVHAGSNNAKVASSASISFAGTQGVSHYTENVGKDVYLYVSGGLRSDTAAYGKTSTVFGGATVFSGSATYLGNVTFTDITATGNVTAGADLKAGGNKIKNANNDTNIKFSASTPHVLFGALQSGNPQTFVDIRTDSNQVHASTNEFTHYGLAVRNHSTTQNAFAGIAFDVADEENVDRIGASIAALRTSADAANHSADIVFATNNNDNSGASDDALTERVRITSDGKVGIGVTSPSRALDVNGDVMIRGNDILDSGGNVIFSFDGSGNLDIVGNVTQATAEFTDVNVAGGDLTFGNGQNAEISVLGVSGTDTVGKNITISGGPSTGNAAGGSIDFKVAQAGGSSGTGTNAASTTILSLSPTTGVATFAGSIQIPNNDSIKNGDGENVISVDANQNVTIAGDLTVSGNDIKDAGGNTALTFNGTSGEITNEVTFSGNSAPKFMGNNGVQFANDIKHEGDLDTKMRFFEDEITFEVGGFGFLKLKESTDNVIVLNEAGTDCNIRMEAITTAGNGTPAHGNVDADHSFFLRGDTGQIGLGVGDLGSGYADTRLAIKGVTTTKDPYSSKTWSQLTGSSDDGRLDLYANNAVTARINSNGISMLGGDGTAEGEPGLLIVRRDTSTTTNDLLGGIGFDSNDGNVPATILNASAFIAAYAAESHSGNDKGGYLVLGTSAINDDDDTASVEQLRVGSDGLITLAGDIQVGGNDIKASDGTTAVTMSGADVTIAGDLTVTGNDIVGTALKLDSSGDITLSADGDQIKMDDGSSTRFTFNVDSTPELDVSGAFTLDGSSSVTIDAATSITLDAGGDITLDAAGDDIIFADAGSTRFTFNLDTTPEIDVAGDFTIDCDSNIEFNADGGTFTFKDNSDTVLTVSNTEDFAFDLQQARAGGVDQYIAHMKNTTANSATDILKLDHSYGSSPTTNHTFIGFFTAGTRRGQIRGDGSGGVELNNSFTGHHPTVISSAARGEVGMIVQSTGQVWAKSPTSVGVSTGIPKVQLTSSANSKKVFGVIAEHYVGDNEPYGYLGYVEEWGVKNNEVHILVNSLGEGQVWVTNKNGDIENGDYIVSSDIEGYGELQSDDVLRSATVAKCVENIDWDSVSETIDHNGSPYKKYLTACTYHCG